MQNVLMGSLGIPDSVLARARRVTRDISRGTTDLGGSVSADAAEILTGRAGLLGIGPAGLISAGGSTRLLACRDGWCALTLSRVDDIETVPALLELTDKPADPWAALTVAAADRDAAEFVARARLLDLPAAVLGEVAAAPPRFVPSGHRAVRAVSELLVVDLSSMWAGPLCGHLLAAAGATVVKVEGRNRVDGTRRGHPAFFDWMNSSKLSYAIDFGDDELRPLLEVADVVIEGSRPAALTRRGLGPEQVRGRDRAGSGCASPVMAPRGSAPTASRSATMPPSRAVSSARGRPVFVGDAIADPLTGLEATRAVLDALGRGGGEIVEIALAEVAASYATQPLTVPENRRAAPDPAATAPGRRARQRQPPRPGTDRSQARRMLIRRGRLPDGHTADVRVDDHIVEIADTLDASDTEHVLDADGGAVLPGLHDHHLHLRAMAAALDSLAVGPPQVRTKAQLAQVLANASPAPTAGSARSATTCPSPVSSTANSSTRSLPTLRCGSSTAAVRCGS